ncbi:cilia- and flagella-associated protein 337-like [Clytia hemisphaerica]|uniref:Uncharacterized protein n=1 Tax=Clytia hemisphaerica TaxID=252671 RepID=A0A7M5WZ54_9CNID
MSSTNSLSSVSTQTFLTSLDSTDLKAIEDTFHSFSGKNLVNKSEFGVMLSQALNKGTLVDYYQLFDMVDISREGLINWDRFSNYLLLEYYEREDRIKTTQVPQWQDIRSIPTSHKNSICCILQNTNNGFRYCTVSKDGLVSVFTDRHEVKRTCQIHTNPEEIRNKDLWVTDATLMPNINKIAFATTSREIWIYDISLNNEFVCQYKITGMKFIPLCINYWSNKNNNNSALLTFGDTGGFIHAIFFNSATSTLFDKPWKSEQSQEVCFQVNIGTILSGRFASASCLHYKAHSAWVRQIMFIPLLDCFLTCSTTSNDSIVLAWLGKSRKDVRLTEFKIPLGINGFDYQESMNLIASAGINNHVCLWNPYVVSKPIGILRGHMQVIVAVQFIHNKYQLVSLSKDKVLRIWDVNLQICIQRLTGIFPKGPDVNILMHYDQEASALFSTFNYHFQVLKMKREVKHRVVSHDSSVTEAIYNEKYGHVISVDESSCITIWFLNTGQKVKQISEAHGEAELTTVCLDHTQTRILTAGTDGVIKIWDINGNCHHILVVEKGNPCEITQIVYLKRMILAIGWSRILCYFPSTQLKSYYVYPADWKGKQEHFDDILSADFSEPRTLVTASYDGDIVFWNTNTQNSIRKITNENKSRLGNRLPPLSPRKSRQERRNESSMSTKSNNLLTPHSPLRSACLDENTASSITVTSIAYLKKRNTNSPRTADLYSCHSDGRVRFWNSLTCENLGSFAVYEQFGSLVSCTNSTNELLCVGGENGTCKIFFIDDFLNDKKHDVTIPLHSDANEHEPPQLLAMFSTHTDVITSVKFIERNGKILLLSSSTDCSVAIHSLDFLIGIFGQKDHWNVNDVPGISVNDWITKRQDDINRRTSIQHDFDCDADNEEELETLEKESEIVIEVPSNNKTNATKDEKPYSNTTTTEFWNQPEIQQVVDEINKSKLDSNQNNNRTNRLPIDGKRNCSYSSLATKQMANIKELEKPEFVLHPERYFLEKDDKNTLDMFSDAPKEYIHDVKLKHDEKSIFPKYILDMDMKMRTAHKLMVTKQPTKLSLHRGGKNMSRRSTLLSTQRNNTSDNGFGD